MLPIRMIALFILVACFSCLLVGCTININVGDSSEEATKEVNSKFIFDDIINGEDVNKTMYESWATIYISNSTVEDAEFSISQSDLATSEALLDTYITIFNTNAVQDKIRQEYPDMEYTVTIEQIDKTAVLKIKATSENLENLEEICNMAVSLLCEKAAQIVEGSSCKVIDYPKPAQLVGTN